MLYTVVVLTPNTSATCAGVYPLAISDLALAIDGALTLTGSLGVAYFLICSLLPYLSTLDMVEWDTAPLLMASHSLGVILNGPSGSAGLCFALAAAST